MELPPFASSRLDGLQAETKFAHDAIMTRLKQSSLIKYRPAADALNGCAYHCHQEGPEQALAKNVLALLHAQVRCDM